MGEHSHIEWTDATWNPWYGCIKISTGCKSCYMYREMRQYGRDPRTPTRSKTKFEDPLKWQKAIATGKAQGPRFVFTCLWSDFFITQADGWRAEAWDIIRRCPDIVFLILTKRIDRAADCLPEDWCETHEGYQNVMLMTSCEDQASADKRIPQLKNRPARPVRRRECPILFHDYLLDEFRK